MTYFIYYISFLIFPLIIYFIKKRYFFLILISLIFIYSRFIETELLFVNDYKINVGFKAKYALIADIHLGIYNDASLLERALEKVKDVDALFIAGDFTYGIDINKIDNLFKSFSTLNIPIYAVLGNHDCEDDNVEMRKELEKTLSKNNIIILQNDIIKVKDINIVGLGSHFCKEDDLSLLNSFSEEDNVIVLAHNPDTALGLNINQKPDLFLTGHTHGGQIRIPFIYKYIIPIEGEVIWDQGLYNYKHTKVFVTSGLGEIGLPMRFLIPPTVDIIELY